MRIIRFLPISLVLALVCAGCNFNADLDTFLKENIPTKKSETVKESDADTKDFGGPPNGGVLTANDETGWTNAISAINAGGNNKNYVINLGGNVTLPQNSLNISETDITVSLRGNHTINLTGDGILFTINSMQTLILRDVKLEGHLSNNDSLVKVNGGMLEMKGASSITNNNTLNKAGGVYVAGGTFIMNDNASVHDNTSDNYEGGVYVAPGAFFIMNGNASVHDNTADINAGGVASDGFFTMNDNASVRDNTSSSGIGGGGVFIVSGTFTMNGGSITGNRVLVSGDGGGVIVFGGTFNMYGGTISGNTTGGNGGGVYISSSKTFNLNTPAGTGSVSGNTATLGPQVYNNGGTFTVNASPGSTY